jgi:FIST N domain
MKTEQMCWTQESGWEPASPGGLGAAAQLVLLFWSPSVLKEQQLDEIKKAYPNAHLFGCSTFGEIYKTQLFDNSLVVNSRAAHVWGQLLTFQGKTCSHFGSFTSIPCGLTQEGFS